MGARTGQRKIDRARRQREAEDRQARYDAQVEGIARGYSNADDALAYIRTLSETQQRRLIAKLGLEEIACER